MQTIVSAIPSPSLRQNELFKLDALYRKSPSEETDSSFQPSQHRPRECRLSFPSIQPSTLDVSIGGPSVKRRARQRSDGGGNCWHSAWQGPSSARPPDFGSLIRCGAVGKLPPSQILPDVSSGPVSNLSFERVRRMAIAGERERPDISGGAAAAAAARPNAETSAARDASTAGSDEDCRIRDQLLRSRIQGLKEELRSAEELVCSLKRMVGEAERELLQAASRASVGQVPAVAAGVEEVWEQWPDDLLPAQPCEPTVIEILD